MKVLVTGGAGYIGSVLVSLLLNCGHRVTVLDHFTHGNNSLGFMCHDPSFDVHKIDCRTDSWVPFVSEADAIIPLAALVGQPICDANPVDARLLNYEHPLALLKHLSPKQLLVFPSTESVYGANVTLCTEETPTNPLSSYARMKLDVEQAALQRENTIVFRFATVFGMSPRMRIDLLVNDFTWRALKDRALVVFEGRARRTVVHVADVAAAFANAIWGLIPKGQIYNVGGVTLSKLSLCEEIKKQVPHFHYVETQYGTDPDARDYIVSDEKIRSHGFTSRVSLEQGITELLTGYRMLTNTRHGNV